MPLKIKSDLQRLQRTLDRHRRLPELGENWARQAATSLEHTAKDHLQRQGRGGQGPPLSPLTEQIYDRVGQPDGSGLFDHITVEFRRSGPGFVAICGIPEGRPTLIAKVQDRGATIPVTDKMRGYFAAVFGIGLSPNTTHLYVPPRHFWSASLQKVNAQAKRDIQTIMRRKS